MLSKHFFLPFYVNMGPPPHPSRGDDAHYKAFSVSKIFKSGYVKGAELALRVDVYYSWCQSRVSSKLMSQYYHDHVRSKIRSATRII